jgi:chorismate mutase
MKLQAKLTFAVTLAIVATGMAYPQNAADRLQLLVKTSARRLLIARQVALAKWDSGAPVEDAAREEQVIATARKAAEARGLDQSLVSNFFRAQIEANKVVQYSLLAEWHRAGKAPDHTPVDLAKMIRPELDELQTELIAELADTSGLRAGASCRVDIARAVGRYVSEHKAIFGSPQAIALDRAMAAACTS